MLLKKPTRLFLALVASALLATNFSCDDETSKIGQSLTQGDIAIHTDTTYHDLHATSVAEDNYDSRSGSLMIGNIDIPEYGKLSCSFVSRLLPITQLPTVVDTLPMDMIDSCKVFIRVIRGNITGDSLAPQKLAVYKLNRQLPSNISNAFDPTGYYDASKPLGTKSFVMSNLGKGDTAYLKASYIPVDVTVPVEVAHDAIKNYKENPSIFAWPQSFAQYFPGLYVKSTFGKGCVSTVSQLMVVAYYRYKEVRNIYVDSVFKDSLLTIPDSLALFSATPEVLSSNNIRLQVAQKLRDRIASGEQIITTPGGYSTRLRFPAREIITQYDKGNKNLSIVSSLTMSIPAEKVENNYGISVSPYLLLVRTKDLKTFFAENKLPDNKTSFSAAYDPITGSYHFGMMRDYFMELLSKDRIEDEDVDFSLVPVNLTGETSGSDTYYSTSTYYVTKCLPYMEKPTMTLVNTKKAEIVLTFSSQEF